MNKLHVWRNGAWKPVTAAERKLVEKWTGMDAMVALNGHVFVRNSKGQYDRWRGVKHKPGDEPQ